jgi:hypothetical protein
MTDPRELIVTSRQRGVEGGRPPHLDAELTRLWGCPLLASDTRLVHGHRPGMARRTTPP